MKVLVTGGAGYIGSHTVVELIHSGYSPIIVDDFRNSEDWIIQEVEKIVEQHVIVYQCDCTNYEELKSVFLQEKDIHAVIHFAADKAVGESVDQPLKYYKNNVGSLVNLLVVMEEFNCNQLVFSSSCTVYGTPDTIPVDESAPIKKAESPYGNTKIISEQIIQDAAIANAQLKAVILRYFNPIGAHSSGMIGELPLGKPNNLVPFITQTASGVREELVVFGDDYDTPDGTCIRDYIHVSDLAEAHCKAINYLKKGTNQIEHINIGTGQGTSVLEIIETFEEVYGKKLPWKFGERRSGDVVQIFAASEKAEKLLNWRSQYSISDALRHAWKWEKRIRKID